MILTQILQKISRVFAKKSELSDYLPLSGGKMSGIISRNVDNDRLLLSGAPVIDDGSHLELCGKNYTNNPGGFYIRAGNGSDNKWLSGTANGTLNWDGDFTANAGKDGAFKVVVQPTASTSIRSLASDSTVGAFLDLCNKNDTGEDWKGAFRLSTSKNGTDLSGFTNGSLQWCGKGVDCIEEQGDGYIRYTNGLQMCWGELFTFADRGTWTYPKTFKSAPRVLWQAYGDSSDFFDVAGGGTRTTSNATFIPFRNSANSFAPYGVDCFAIGFWK